MRTGQRKKRNFSVERDTLELRLRLSGRPSLLWFATMKNIIALFAIWLAGVAPISAEEVIKSPGPEDEQAVISATKEYVAALDASKYDESWAQFAPEIQKTMIKFTHTSGMKLMRTGLGDIKMRKPIGLSFIKDLKNAPPGSYAAYFLDSEFQRVSGQEKVILMKSQGKWMIAGYFFEKSVRFDQKAT